MCSINMNFLQKFVTDNDKICIEKLEKNKQQFWTVYLCLTPNTDTET